MAAPSKAWSAIADSQIDADSPLDTTLVTSIRDSLIHLEEWLGMSYTAAQDHDHDGVNSKYTTPSINVVRTWDDFLDPNVSEWTKTGTVGVVTPGKNGLCSILGGASAYSGIFQTGRPWILTGPTITYETTVKHVDGTSEAVIGLSEDGTFNNSIAFRRVGASANWRCYTTNGGTSTNTDSGIAFATGAFKTFKIIATPTSIAFYIDGSLVATNTTNIPTAAYMGVLIYPVYDAYTAYVDYIHCYTNSRM